jgi:integrase
MSEAKTVSKGADGFRVSQEQLKKLFDILKYDETTKSWKNISMAERQLGMSRPKIYRILKHYKERPEKPKKTTPAYFQEFEQTACSKKIVELTYDRNIKGLSSLGLNFKSVLREAWKARNKKDPLTFDLADYLFFWGTQSQAPYPSFVDPMTNKISFAKAVALRFSMRYGKARDLVDDPRFTTKGLKRDPQKKAFYLEEGEILGVVANLPCPDAVMLTYAGILMGGRFSSFGGTNNRKTLGLKVGDIHRQALFLTLKEIKVGETVEKDLFDFTLDFIWQYVIDYGIADVDPKIAANSGAQGKLFSWDLKGYNKILSEASRKAGLPENKIMTSHMLKHTCITQMGLHGIDIDVISDYVGTDADTIMKFYRGGGRDKIRSQILNLPRKQETWKEFVQRIHPYFVEQYRTLRDRGTPTIFGAKPKGVTA